MNRPVEPLDCWRRDAQASKRRATRQVRVQWGERIVKIGGNAPIVEPEPPAMRVLRLASIIVWRSRSCLVIDPMIASVRFI